MERIERALEIARLQLRAREPASATATAAAVEAAPTVVTSPAALSRPARPAVAAAIPTPHVVHGALLPRYSLQRETLRERCVLLADDPSAAARAYRMLRAQLLQRVRASRMRVFGVVSAVSGEGKTITAINLALALAAEPNQQVALLDFDLRHPCIASTLGIAPATGLDSWLTEGAQPASAVLCELEGIARLQIAPTLAAVGSSSECLAGARARALLEELREDDGRVLLLDLPPALLSDDVLTVSPLVDGFIFVVTEGRTRREDVERVIELVGRARIVGTVLNGSIDSEQRAY
ncbi:MAG TPA: P-loop NTPase [Steroidobacteraceae bacterium]|nr:P-loop NTPase [Steroidobacteraceae bacterium]